MATSICFNGEVLIVRADGRVRQNRTCAITPDRFDAVFTGEDNADLRGTARYAMTHRGVEVVVRGDSYKPRNARNYGILQ
jgi:hypothetical protein